MVQGSHESPLVFVEPDLHGAWAVHHLHAHPTSMPLSGIFSSAHISMSCYVCLWDQISSCPQLIWGHEDWI